MGLSAGKPLGLQFKLGQVMKLNVYLAFILASIALVARAEGRAAFVLTLAGVTTGLPFVLYIVSLHLLRPSPRRDALAIVFLILPGLSLAVWTTLLVTFLIRNPAALGPGMTSRKLQFIAIPTLFLVWLAIPVLVWISFRGRCPACRRWGLVPSPAEMRFTRRRSLLFEFAWCVACGARWKRNRTAPSWADAADSAYDGCFGLGPTATFPPLLADSRTVSR